MEIRLSSGSAAALGLVHIRRGAEVGTIYIMLGEGDCAFSCSFCPQGRASATSRRLLSRITWPEFPVGEVLSAIASLGSDAAPRRTCLQVLGGDRAVDRAEEFLVAYRSAGCRLPVSVNAAIFSPDPARRLFAAGCQRLGLALDAATPALFRSHKLDRPGAFEGRLVLLERLAAEYPGRISTHFIAGLGETEEEMVAAVARVLEAGITVGLFALTPIRGTPLEGAIPPEMGSYRRMQLARHLLAEGRAKLTDFHFIGGRIARIDAPFDAPDLARAFRTSGCPDCNRPYYNERPGELPYNYPAAPSPGEIWEALRATGLAETVRNPLGAEEVGGGD